MPVCGDWNGDGIDTVGVFDPRTARFYLINSVTRAASTPLIQVQFGGPGVLPVAGDWDGDGHATLGVWDPLPHYVYLINSLAPGAPRSQYSTEHCRDEVLSIAGDWGVDGKDGYGFWYGASLELMSAPGGSLQDVSTFGQDGSVPVVGDWNGDGSIRSATARATEAGGLRHPCRQGSTGRFPGRIGCYGADRDGCARAMLRFGSGSIRAEVRRT